MSPSTSGARSATGRIRKPLGWLPWVLLLVLAVVIALVVLVVVVNDDDEDGAAAHPDALTLVTQAAAA
jgi:hypothetical protein